MESVCGESTTTMVLILTPLEVNVLDMTTVSTEFAGKYFGNVSFISLKKSILNPELYLHQVPGTRIC